MKLRIPNRKLLPGESKRVDLTVATARMKQVTGETAKTFRSRVVMVADRLERDARGERPGRPIQTVIKWSRRNRSARIKVTEYRSHGG